MLQQLSGFESRYLSKITKWATLQWSDQHDLARERKQNKETKTNQRVVREMGG
jgi:hypothetical protein